MQLTSTAGEAGKRFGRTIRQIQTEMAARGVRQSSMNVLRVLDAMDEEFDAATNGIFRELTLALENTNLDPNELRVLARDRVTVLSEMFPEVAVSQLGSAASLDSMQVVIEERCRLLRERRDTRLRQFDIGFWRDPSRSTSVTNSVQAHTITGGVQMASPNASQIIHVSMDMNQVREAVAALEAAMGNASLDEGTSAEIHAELDTIKSQLRKQKPSGTILREAAKTLRSLVEGIAAGVLTPEAIVAAGALSSAIGG